MKPPTPIYISTRKLAELAGVHDSVIHAAVSRKGHYKGVRPQQRGDSTGWAWPASEVYGALGLISSLAPWWAGALQGRLVENLGVDQLAAYRFCAWLAENVRPDCTPDERIAGAVDDLELLVGLAHAQLERLGSALVREELVTDPQWLALQKHARELARVSDSFVRRSRWKWVADGAGGAS